MKKNKKKKREALTLIRVRMYQEIPDGGAKVMTREEYGAAVKQLVADFNADYSYMLVVGQSNGSIL